jgi:para-aminobenzoate synthetase component 1
MPPFRSRLPLAVRSGEPAGPFRAGPGATIMPAMARLAPVRSAIDLQPPGGSIRGGVLLERWPALDELTPLDVADALPDRTGLALLETARRGRRDRWTFLATDPLAVLDAPAEGPDPFADARLLLARLAGGAPGTGGAGGEGDAVPPFVGGLVGYLGYDLGGCLEHLPHRVPDDQGLPDLRLALHDLVIAWDGTTGRAWLGGRALDGDLPRLDRRAGELRARLEAALADGRAGTAGAVAGLDHRGPTAPAVFRSSMDRPTHRRSVESIQVSIADGEIYQANLARRLEAPFGGDPWPVYRRLRRGDPARYAAFLDVGPSPITGAARAILSASPEPFLAVRPGGLVSTDPIKGTRPRGRDRAEERQLAGELLASVKDRAENVMIVDVLRNDLGRVCQPGSVRVPRLCRLERTATVQHLVSTITGRLAQGRDPFDLLAASFPGGSITGAPKLRAIELLEDLEPVRRGPYTGALGWISPDGTMGTSILIRTFVADGRRLTLHVGGGITRRSDPDAEWDETVAKARGPLGAIGAREVG